MTLTNQPNNKQQAATTGTGKVYCPMCTHTVDATIEQHPRRHLFVKPGQKCPRCSSSLDAGYIMRFSHAA